MKAWIILALLLAGGGVWWWQQKPHAINAPISATTMEAQASTLPLTVTVTHPVLAELSEALELTGAIVPVSEVLATSDLSGVKVLTLLAEEGDSVKQGQVLARLDTESLQYQLQQLEAQRQRSEEEFHRLDRIKQSGAVSKDELSQKWLALQSSIAQYNDLKLKLERAAILAPAHGVIYERGIASGALLVGGEVLFRIASGGLSEVEVQVPETQLSRLATGQSGTITLASGEKLEGAVRRVTPRIDPVQRTAAVRISLPSKSFYPVGAFATVKLTVGRHQGLTLPLTALQKDGDGDFIWIIDGGKARVQRITPQFRDNSRVIADDLATEWQVVATAGAFLQVGDVVQTTPGTTP